MSAVLVWLLSRRLVIIIRNRRSSPHGLGMQSHTTLVRPEVGVSRRCIVYQIGNCSGVPGVRIV